MFARVTTLQLQPGKLDEFLRIFQDSIAPAAAAQPGFGGITLLTDPRLGKVLAVGLWQTEVDLLAGEAGYYPEYLARVGGLVLHDEVNHYGDFPGLGVGKLSAIWSYTDHNGAAIGIAPPADLVKAAQP